MRHDSELAFPLAWPETWKRTKWPAVSRFRTIGVGQARDGMLREFDRLGAKSVVISTNLPVRRDGLPYANERLRGDGTSGVAVYFRLAGQPRVLACDTWSSVACNMVAIRKHVEALRGIDRWGVGSVEQAFAGYARLEAAGSKSWRSILGVGPEGGLDEARARYRELAARLHPDVAGADSHDAFVEVGEAWKLAQTELGGGS